MAENPGSQVLILSESLGVSEGSAPNINDTVVLYSSGLARGESNPSPGQDVLMISESDAQTGPSSFRVDGEPIGFFETDETAEEFWDYGPAGDDGIQANAKGLKEFGMDDDPDVATTYVFVHHSTSTDRYSLGVWHYKEGESSTYEMRVEVGGSAENFPDPGSPLVEDEPESSSGEEYGTTTDGDAYAGHNVSSMENGDGVMWEMNKGSYDLDFKYGPRDGSDPRTDQVRFRGPEGNLEKQLSESGTFTFSISFS